MPWKYIHNKVQQSTKKIIQEIVSWINLEAPALSLDQEIKVGIWTTMERGFESIEIYNYAPTSSHDLIF